MFAKNENGKDRCSLNRNLEGKKGTQFSISLGKNLLLIEKHKCGHILTKWILFSTRDFKLRFSEDHSGWLFNKSLSLNNTNECLMD